MGKGDVKVAIIGDASSLVSALGKSSAASQAFGGVFAGVGMAFGQNLMGMAHSVANFAGDSIQKFMDWGANVRTIMRETGMDAEGASRLGAVAKASGVSIDDLTTSLKMFDKALVAGKLDNYNDAMDASTDQAEELTDAQLKLGEAQERVGDLQVLQSQKAKKTYSDQIAMREALQDLTKAQEELRTAQEASSVSIDKYGLSVRNADGSLRPMWDILVDSADVFEKMGDGPEAAALAMKMFGRNGMAMLPFLQQGKDGLEGLAAAAERTGLVIGDESMEKWKKARQASRELSITWEGLQVQIGEYLVPALTSVTNWAKDTLPGAIEGAKKWLNDHKQDFINIKDAAVDLWNKLQGWKDWWEKNIGDGEDFARGLKKIDEWLKNINQWIVDHIGTWEDMRHGFLMIGDAASWVGDKLGWLKDHVLDPLVGVIQTLSELWGGLADKVGNTMFTGVLGFAYNQISGNAQGGFLPDGWAMVGENGPELAYTRGGQTSITPNQQSQGAMTQGAQTINLTIPVSVGGQNLGTITRRLDLAVT